MVRLLQGVLCGAALDDYVEAAAKAEHGRLPFDGGGSPGAQLQSCRIWTGFQ